MTTSTLCARNLPQHFNGCTCVAGPGTVTAEVTDIDLVPLPDATDPTAPYGAVVIRRPGTVPAQEPDPNRIERTPEQVALDDAYESRAKARWALSGQVQTNMNPLGLQVGDCVVMGDGFRTVIATPTPETRTGGVMVRTVDDRGASEPSYFGPQATATVRWITPDKPKFLRGLGASPAREYTPGTKFTSDEGQVLTVVSNTEDNDIEEVWRVVRAVDDTGREHTLRLTPNEGLAHPTKRSVPEPLPSEPAAREPFLRQVKTAATQGASEGKASGLASADRFLGLFRRRR